MKIKVVFYALFASFITTISIILLIIYWNNFNTFSGKASDNDNSYRIAYTRNGYIRGIRYWSLPNYRAYYSYLGIPYAEPPINDLRFRVIF